MQRSWMVVMAGIVLGLSLAAAGVAFMTWPREFRGSQIDPARMAGDFRLTDQHGNPFHLDDGSQKVSLIFFGYTSCPDVCPTTLAEYKRIRAELGSQADGVRFLFVTVDPQRDTPERLQAYIAKFDEQITGLTGPEDTLRQVWADYGVMVERDGSPDDTAYLVSHSARVYAVDRAGRLRLTFPFGTAVEDLTHDLRLLLREKIS